MSNETMRDRLNTWRANREYQYVTDIAALVADMCCEFAESEVRRALAPRDASPELAEAEERIRMWAGCTEDFASNLWEKAIVAELDRLRAQVAKLEAERTAVATILRTIPEVPVMSMGMEDTYADRCKVSEALHVLTAKEEVK